MRSLIVSALMMSTMALSAAAAGTYQYCTAGSRILTERVVSMNADLTSYTGVNCETDPKVNVILDASVMGDGFGITGTYTDGTIGSGGALQIIGPSADVVAAVAPILIRIERNIFEQDAVLHVKGSFPVTSLVTISGNQFNVGAPHEMFRTINTNFIAAVVFGDYEKDMVLFTNAQLTVYDNAINVADATGDSQPYEVYGVYASSNVYLSNEAGLLIQRNNITGTTVGNTYKAVGVYCPRYAFMVGNNTLAQIQGNRMELTNGIMFHSPSIAVSDGCSAHADFSQNNGTLTPIHSTTYGAIIGPVNLTATSSVEIADNILTNVNPSSTTASVRIFFNGPAAVREQSSLYIWFNTLNTQGGSPQIAFGGTIRTQQEGKLMIVGNQMVRQDGLTLGLNPVHFYSLILEDNSSVAVSQNVWGSTNPNNKPVVFTMSTAPAAPASMRAENATFDVCHNQWYGAEFASTSEIAALTDAKIRGMLSDLAECPGLITTTTMAPKTTTTVTTTRPGTTVPADNGAAGMAKVAAGSALLAAVLACLL